MAIRTPAYFKWRDGRPRWEPGPRLRDAGFKGRDLRDEAGRWLGLELAIAQAEGINSEVEAWRAGVAPLPRPARPISHQRTCRVLAEKYFESADFTRLAVNTKADYRRKIAIFLGTEFGDAPVGAVTKPQMVGYWQQLYGTRGHAMASGIVACISALFGYATLIGWRADGSNPGHKLKRPKLPPRIAIWTPDKAAAYVAMGDEMKLPEVGDALVLALHTSQRLGDILDMPLRLLGDRVMLTQMKRKALIDAPMTPQLAARVRSIKARIAAIDVIRIDTRAISDITGQPYDRFSFNKVFRKVRAATLKKHPDLDQSHRFAPGLSTLTFQDTRDTAVTRLAMAGCTLPQIAAITGHSPAHITAVIKHYLALDVAMADEGISRLSAWLEINTIAI